MKKGKKILAVYSLLLPLLSCVGCGRNTYDVWEDTKSCGRHMNRGLRTLGGKSGDSRAVNCPDDFYCIETYEEEFIPLQDDCSNQRLTTADLPPRQPRETPGDPGSSIPGIEAFYDPSLQAELGFIFQNIHFAYNQHLIKGDNNFAILRGIAAYIRQYPRTYLFVEGHCDERGPEAYNLALGARRANVVRTFLINEGVHPDHIFTISYGKERPLVMDHHEEAWAQNRRAEFKIYQK